MRYLHLLTERLWTFQDKTKFDGDQWLMLFASPTDDGPPTTEWISPEDLSVRDIWCPMP